MGSEEARNHGLYCGNKLPPVSGMIVMMVVMMVVVMMRIFMSMVILTVTMMVMT